MVGLGVSRLNDGIAIAYVVFQWHQVQMQLARFSPHLVSLNAGAGQNFACPKRVGNKHTQPLRNISDAIASSERTNLPIL